MKVLEFKEESTCFWRTTCLPSLRPFKMNTNNFYNDNPL